MAFTYNPALVSALDRLRIALGDTDAAAALLPDETYGAILLASEDDEGVALVSLARYMIARYSQLPTRITSDSDTVEWRERLAGWWAIVNAANQAAAALLRSPMQAHRPVRSDYEDTGSEYGRARREY